MPRQLLPVVLVAGFATSAWADKETEVPGTTWTGAISLGVELDERGLPVAEQDAPAVSPGRIRIGFAATWSFSLNWERVRASGQPPEPDKLSNEEAQLLELTNAERKRQKLPPLKIDPALMKLARAHAATMARLDQIGHDIGGKTFSQRMEGEKYMASRAGENVAEGQRTPAEAIRSWMQSPGHKGNILQAEYTHIGIAGAKSKSGKQYWTQIFAKPFSRPLTK
jgi:uncharacterized protein YkwD